MIALDVVQGSAQWRQARIGIPTASCFAKIVTPKTLKPSAQADGYMHLLLAEWALGVPLDGSGTTAWMERGSSLEEDAVLHYEIERNVEARPGGFVMRDDRMAGCSPDRFVGEDGLLQVKCPGPAKHVGYLLGESLDDAHRAQVQGELLLTGRAWCDIESYHPDLPAAIVRVERDAEFLEAFVPALDAFIARLLDERTRFRDRGWVKPGTTEEDRLILDVLADVATLKVDLGEEVSLPELRSMPIEDLRALHDEIRARRMAIPEPEDSLPF